MQRGVRMYHDQTTRPLHDMRWELMTLLAHGAFVTMVDKAGFDGQLDPVAYDRIGAAFKEAHAKREHFGQTPVAEVGIYFSSRTRDWLGREQAAEYFHSFQGAQKAMVYEHIPWGILLDENGTLERLRQFPVLLLPHAAIFSEREVALLKDYVQEGGNLILTGWTSMLGWQGEPREESALRELAGAHLIRRLDSLDNWVRLPGHPEGPTSVLGHGIPPGAWPFLVKGPAAVLEATSAQPVGELLQPFRTMRQREGKEGTDWPMSADAPVGPAVLLNEIGRGKALTFACSPDYATASEHHIAEARRLLANAVRFLHPNPRIRIMAPNTVEAIVTDDRAKRTLRVHLLGYNAPPQTTPAKDRPHVLPGLIEDAPMYRAIVELAEPIKRAMAINKSTKLTRHRRRLEVMVNDIHEIVIVSY